MGWWVPGTGGGESGEPFHGDSFSSTRWKEVWGQMVMAAQQCEMYFIPLGCALKNSQNGKRYVYFTTIKHFKTTGKWHGEIPCTLFQFLNGNTLSNSSAISQPGYWHCCRKDTELSIITKIPLDAFDSHPPPPTPSLHTGSQQPVLTPIILSF